MLTIREAQCADYRQVSYVHVDTWRVAYRGIIGQEVLNRLSYGRSQDNWKRCQEKMSQYFYVAEEDNLVVGFIVGGPARDEELVYDAEIYALYILPKYQRQGIGTKLIQRIAQDFHKEKWVQFLIWCLKKNPSIKFYESLGGILTETKKIKIGDKNLIDNGYVFETENFLEVLT